MRAVLLSKIRRGLLELLIEKSFFLFEVVIKLKFFLLEIKCDKIDKKIVF